MEIWKSIPTAQDYEVSNLGRIRVYRTKSGAPAVDPRFVSLSKNREGYVMVNINQKLVSLHRVVATVFLGPLPDGMQTCHNDDDKGNNAVSNLRYDTPKNNLRDRDANGKTAIGERNGKCKMSPFQAKAIANMLKDGQSKNSIAKHFGVTIGAVHSIAEGRSWRWVTGLPKIK